MYEELFYETETIKNTSHSKIFLAKHSAVNHDDISSKISKIFDLYNSFDDDKIRNLLKDFVPFFNNSETNIVPINKKKNEKSN